jgi:hypothetical protein
MHGIHTLSRTALASIPNLSAIGTMHSGRLKTSLRKQFGGDRNKYKLLRESAWQITHEIPKIQCSPQCQCRQPSHSPHACGLEAAFSSVRNTKVVLLLLCFLKFYCFYSYMVYMLSTKFDTRDEPGWSHIGYEPTGSSLTCKTTRWHISN